MTWSIDNSHSHVGFSIKHMMVATVRGQFHDYSGVMTIDPDNLANSTVTGEIAVSSIDTRDAKRDEHLKSADFFNVEAFPTITYRSTRVEKTGDDTFKVFGDLTIKDVTKEVALDIEYSGTAKDPWGNTKTGFSATGTINRKDFGLGWNAVLETGGVLVGETVKIQLDIEAVVAAPVAAAIA